MFHWTWGVNFFSNFKVLRSKFLNNLFYWFFYLLKMIQILSSWYSRVVLRLWKDNKKKLFRNLERTALKLERNKSHLIFNETCYNNDILPKYTGIKLYRIKAKTHWMLPFFMLHNKISSFIVYYWCLTSFIWQFV